MDMWLDPSLMDEQTMKIATPTDGHTKWSQQIAMFSPEPLTICDSEMKQSNFGE